MVHNEIHGTRESAESNRRTADREVVETNTFANLQAEVEAVGLDELLTDPDYLAFLDGVGSLDMPDDDDLSLDDLVEMDAEAAPAAAASDPSSTPSEADRSAFVDVLIDALERDAVSDAQRAHLREALGLQTRNSTDVQLQYLKSRFLDLEAYLQTMEAFFDRRQTPLEELDAQREDLAALQNAVDSLHDCLGDVQAALDTVASQQADYDDRLTALEQSLERTQTALQRKFGAIETELARSNRWRQRVSEAARADRSESDSGVRPAESD